MGLHGFKVFGDFRFIPLQKKDNCFFFMLKFIYLFFYFYLFEHQYAILYLRFVLKCVSRLISGFPTTVSLPSKCHTFNIVTVCYYWLEKCFCLFFYQNACVAVCVFW